MRLSLWPQSLFGRLIAALVIAVVLAQAASLCLFARDRERFVVESSVREWSRRITEITLLLRATSNRAARRDGRDAAGPGGEARSAARALGSRAAAASLGRGAAAAGAVGEAAGECAALAFSAAARSRRSRAAPAPGSSFRPRRLHLAARELRSGDQSSFWPRIFIQLPFASDIGGILAQQLRAELGSGYGVEVHRRGRAGGERHSRTIAILRPGHAAAY